MGTGMNSKGKEKSGEQPPAEDGVGQDHAAPAPAKLSGALGLWLLSVASGLLVFLSFPPVDVWPLAYVALVPLLVAAGRTPSWKGAALCGLLAGLAAYLPGLAWLASVAVPGWIVLSLYLSLYMVAVALLLRVYRRRFPRAWPVLVALAWVGLEIVRAKAGTGFPWLLVGYTQYKFIALIQLAALTGVYGVSFLVVLVNAALANVALHGLPSVRKQDAHQDEPGVEDAPRRGCDHRKDALRVALGSLCLLAVCSLLGWLVAGRVQVQEGPVVGVVQQNIPRLVSEITAPTTRAEVCEKMRKEIEKAARLSVPCGCPVSHCPPVLL